MPVDPRSSWSGASSSLGEEGVFRVEQLGVRRPRGDSDLGVDLGEELAREVDRVSAVLGRVGESLGVEDVGGGVRARMFAHEVNNLVMGISGRAQRALMSEDAGHARAALEMSAGVGERVAALCRVFLEGAETSDLRSDNRLREVWNSAEEDLDALGGGAVSVGVSGGVGGGVSGFGKALNKSQILSVHEFASNCALGGWGAVLGGRVVFLDDVTEGVRVPMGGVELGQVLLNLYRNALGGIERGWGDDGVGSGRVRLRVFVRGGCGSGGGRCAGCTGACRRGGEGRDVDGEVVVRVEDSGVGFGGGGLDGDGRSGGGYGLGLGVCRVLCGRFGGRVEVGESRGLGGGRVDLIFG